MMCLITKRGGWFKNLGKNDYVICEYSLTNFEIQRYYQKEPRFNGVYSRNNLPKIKGGAYVINIDVCKSIGTHWKALYVNGDNATCFYSFRVEYIKKKKKKLKKKNQQCDDIFLLDLLILIIKD